MANVMIYGSNFFYTDTCGINLGGRRMTVCVDELVRDGVGGVVPPVPAGLR